MSCVTVVTSEGPVTYVTTSPNVTTVQILGPTRVVETVVERAVVSRDPVTTIIREG